MAKNRIYIVDIDGTLADIKHRLQFIQGETKNWDGFFDACDQDKPIEDVINVIRALGFEAWHGGTVEFVYLTGRPERVRGKTQAWLKRQGLPSGMLVMRKDDDHRPDTESKAELMRTILDAGIIVAGVFEDRPSVVRVWREMGLTVFQMNDKEF